MLTNNESIDIDNDPDFLVFLSRWNTKINILGPKMKWL